MKDKLEKFIKQNKVQFDTEVPSKELWTNIEAGLDKQNDPFDFGWVWKVAAILFLISTLVLLFKNHSIETGTTNDQLLSNDGYNSELKEVEAYYTGLISGKKREILAFDIDDPELLEGINSLDSMYTELKKDLRTNQKDDRLINAMIRNLQLRVDILNKQLNILERIKKVENDEKISI